MKHLLCFGTLKKNSTRGYNYNRFGADSQHYLKTFILPGYRMVNLGSYPSVSPHEGSQITVELHEVEDSAFQAIDRMEKSAMYDSVQIPVEHDGKTVEATMYTMPAERLTRYPEVKDGNWYPI